MKTNFTPEEFLTMLNSSFELVSILASSKQYQEILNKGYCKRIDFTLADALEALDNVRNFYEDMTEL